jgi:hypothetical protein
MCSRLPHPLRSRRFLRYRRRRLRSRSGRRPLIGRSRGSFRSINHRPSLRRSLQRSLQRPPRRRRVRAVPSERRGSAPPTVRPAQRIPAIRMPAPGLITRSTAPVAPTSPRRAARGASAKSSSPTPGRCFQAPPTLVQRIRPPACELLIRRGESESFGDDGLAAATFFHFRFCAVMHGRALRAHPKPAVLLNPDRLSADRQHAIGVICRPADPATPAFPARGSA